MMKRSRWSWLTLLAAATAYASPIEAADPATVDRDALYNCRWATGPVKIDGLADEPAWREAEVLDKFIVGWNRGGPRAARTAARARLLWDRDNLYFFADMDDTDLFADVTKHDGACWDNDVFELFFKPAEDKPAYYEFEVNAANTVFDMFVPKRSVEDFPRNVGANVFHLETKVALRGTLNQRSDTDQGWSVEGRIPWSDFAPTGGAPAADAQWRFALCRYDYTLAWKEPDLSSSAPLSKPNFHYYEDYRPIRFVGPQK